MKYTYLLIDLLSVLFPFLFSFHPRLKFYKNWPALFPAMLVSGLLFIGWDMYFTRLKVWGFNPVYLTGFYVGNLPVEEILFFLCIPYACLFTYASLPQKGFGKNKELVITVLLIAASFVIAGCFYQQLYTAVTFVVLGLLLLLARFGFKVNWLARFYQSYLLLLLPFVVVNGLLTGTALAAPVVWYNPNGIFNIRLLTIPVEDIFYGMALILLNLLIYNGLIKRRYQAIKRHKQRSVNLKLNDR